MVVGINVCFGERAEKKKQNIVKQKSRSRENFGLLTGPVVALIMGIGSFSSTLCEQLREV